MTQILPADSEGVTPGSLWWSSSREIFPGLMTNDISLKSKPGASFTFCLKGQGPWRFPPLHNFSLSLSLPLSSSSCVVQDVLEISVLPQPGSTTTATTPSFGILKFEEGIKPWRLYFSCFSFFPHSINLNLNLISLFTSFRISVSGMSYRCDN